MVERDMINQEYFNENEKTDYEKLLAFNDVVHIFSALTHIDGNLHYDASGVTSDGRGARIELKTRLLSLNKYETLLIEDHKLSNLLLDWGVYEDEPLYLNFLDDGVALFNLHQFTKRPKISTGRSYSEGYGGWEYNSRNELYLTDATIYNNDYKLIRNSEWKNRNKQNAS